MKRPVEAFWVRGWIKAFGQESRGFIQIEQIQEKIFRAAARHEAWVKSQNDAGSKWK